MVMLGLGWSVQVLLVLLYLPLRPMDSRSSFSWGELCGSLSPLEMGGVVHLFVIYGYQGAEEDAEKLQLTDKLLQAVLAEARVVCTGQLCSLLGILS